MSKRSENKRAAELNKRMHSLLGYGQAHWRSLPASTFGESLAALEDFRRAFGGNAVASRWMERIIEFVSLSSGTFPAAAASCPTSSSSSSSPSSSSSSSVTASTPVATPSAVTSLPPSQLPTLPGSGGSRPSVPAPRQARGRRDRKEAAMARAVSILGDDAVRSIRDEWRSTEAARGGSEWRQSERIVLQMLQRGLSESVIRAVIPVGGSRVHRLRKALESGVETSRARRPPRVPHHALAADDLEAIRESACAWEVEDDFPCSHRRPRQYSVEPNVTWTELYRRYKANLDAVEGSRVVSYSRWIQYVHVFYPGLRLARTADDACDCCARLDARLARGDLPADERERLLQEKNLPLAAAVAQRRTVSAFVREYVERHAPGQDVPAAVVPDHCDDGEPGAADSARGPSRPPTVRVQVEGFGGSFAMPHCGHVRPSADRFDSSLALRNFVLADVTSGVNSVIFYDERGQGKDADALCSLRFVHHMRLLGRRPGAMPTTLVAILDNRVGQDKSQVAFMFFALLSVLFYRKVVLLYLPPGHSHNQADRVVAWCRNAMRGKNFYTPWEVVDAVNLISGVEATFFDHRDAQRPFYTGWESLLKRHFRPMPPRYASNYFFEVDEGALRMRHLSSTPDDEVTCVPLVAPGNVDLLRRSVLRDIFGADVDTIEQGTLESVRLPTAPVGGLSAERLASLSKKYFSIPPEHLPYYPAAPGDAGPQIDGRPVPEGGPGRATKRKLAAVDATVGPAAEIGPAAKAK
ncbi:uncharacterized protein LOC142908003 [Petromyzon marinus]|uniref:uncharacterized protein LOC142908003 n=1 Tax=Petromyzon marinus TaxID=7757 RepID=UPI003F72B91F